VRIVQSQRSDAARAAAQMGDTCELSVQAAAALCGEGEELTYWQLMVRASYIHKPWPCIRGPQHAVHFAPAHLSNTCGGSTRHVCGPTLWHAQSTCCMEARALDSNLHLKSSVGLQARAASVGRVLYGYYHVPDRSSKPIDFIINPEGMEERAKKRCGPPLWKPCILSA